jgi:hypothetical protein
MVEFLIAFLPVFTFFLCLVQLALLYAVRLVVEHAATNTARAAAVIIGDDPQRYNASKNSNGNVINPSDSNDERVKQIRQAALLTLAPYILNGTIHSMDVEFPPPGQPGGEQPKSAITYTPMDHQTISKVRVRIKVEANCKIGFASQVICRSFNLAAVGTVLGVGYLTKKMVAEAMYPYQGARYEYP